MELPYSVKKKEGTWQKLAIWLNHRSLKYGISSKINARNLTRWRSAGKEHSRFVPMWVVLALQKFIQQKFGSKLNIFYLPSNYHSILNSNFQIKVFKELRKTCKGYRNLAKTLNVPQFTLEKYGRKVIKPLPLYLVLKIIRLFPESVSIEEIQNNTENLPKPEKFNLKNIENNIIAYKYRGTAKPIWHPRLPIKVTPEFTSIIIHMMCDGHLPKEGGGSYKQTNPISKYRFVDKLFNVFGKFEVPEKSLKHNDVKVPAIIAHVIRTYAHDVRFGTFTSRIPQRILEKNKEHKISALSAYIVDDGCVSKGIRLCSANKQLLNDMRLFTNAIYTTSTLRRYKNMFYFDMRIPEAIKFYLDLLRLTKNTLSATLHISRKN